MPPWGRSQLKSRPPLDVTRGQCVTRVVGQMRRNWNHCNSHCNIHGFLKCDWELSEIEEEEWEWDWVWFFPRPNIPSQWRAKRIITLSCLSAFTSPCCSMVCCDGRLSVALASGEDSITLLRPLFHCNQFPLRLGSGLPAIDRAVDKNKRKQLLGNGN